MDFKTCNYKQTIFALVLMLSVSLVSAQLETSKWKFQIAFGLNLPEETGFINPYTPKSTNFPTINLGIQHMFTGTLGAKVDFGYNRMSSTDNTPEFKNNYTRFNAQFVYDATTMLNFLPSQMGVVAHVGPGMSFTKPLGNLTENKETFFNVLGGFEVHYGLSDAVSAFVDTSYIYSFAGDTTYNPVSDGFGAFSGNLFTITVGVSVSLSGCYYCD